MLLSPKPCLTPSFPISYDELFRLFEIERISLSMRTEVPSEPGIIRAWHVIDAEDAVLGRLASRAAQLLMGKHKPIYTPYIDTGDHVIIVNAEKVKLTGNKEGQKLYRRHTGYPGGLIETGAGKLRATRPARMIELAVAGMLPKNKLGKQMYRKLKVYAGQQHPHQAQQPVALDMGKEARR
jgi:large subunit ribosomal protein L13